METDRCDHCGRQDVDDDWLWLAGRRFGDEDCEFDEVDLSFCSQAHAAAFHQGSEIDWERGEAADQSSGVRADLFMFGCGLLAIILSVIGVVALIQWLA